MGASKTIYEPMVCLTQTMLLSCVDTNTVSKQAKIRFHMTQVTKDFLSGVSKMIFEAMVCSAQTMHPSCTDTNTISKRTEMRFHMTRVT
jgi:hypothetical protein